MLKKMKSSGGGGDNTFGLSCFRFLFFSSFHCCFFSVIFVFNLMRSYSLRLNVKLLKCFIFVRCTQLSKVIEQ